MQICRLDEIAKQLLEEEKKVTDAMHLVHQNTDASLRAVKQVTFAHGRAVKAQGSR